jgi:formylglycine-generating enzyme required for sulfatase activity
LNEFIMDIRKNTLGLSMITVPQGIFMMGASPADSQAMWDEKPAHEVEITYSFEMSATEVTNAQYELFDPNHKILRGNGKKTGFSFGDGEAVVNVSHQDAQNFCEWLSKKEGEMYRLPIEAEWEYCCRAGTKSPYWTGNKLPQSMQKDQRLMKKWDAKKFYKSHNLVVGKAEPNPWGFFDMHGNVENWCSDRFGYYTENKETNPLYLDNNTVDGNAYVTRGGSYGVKVEHLRSSRRLGALADDKHWLIGFRVVCGELPSESSRKNTRVPLNSLCEQKISQEIRLSSSTLQNSDDVKQSIYLEPATFLVPPRKEDRIDLRPHNHCPAITWCPNGDILTVWFSTIGEHDRDMVVLGSRLRHGASQYESSSLFFRVPGRNITGSSLYTDGEGKMYHFNGVEVATSWKSLVMILRTSTDNGATWSDPRLICPHHQWRNQVIPVTLETSTGAMVQLCDAVPFGAGGTAFWVSRDKGITWKDLGAYENGMTKPKPRFWNKTKGNWIAGIHGGVVELEPKKFLAYGRANYVHFKTPMSLSNDGGRTWQYFASPFPGITYGQRLVIRKLNEGPILLVSFTDPVRIQTKNFYSKLKGMEMKTLDGSSAKCFGIFAAVSYDDGKTWPVKRMLDSRGAQGIRHEKGFGLKQPQLIDAAHGELKGYLAGTQSPDNMIHIISSRLHYRFNLAWLKEK